MSNQRLTKRNVKSNQRLTKPMKNQRLISEQLKKATYNRSVCKYAGRAEEAAYWNGYIQALSLIIETQQ